MNNNVIMLLSNPAITDSRPIKEAESLISNGYHVVLYAWDRECKYPKNEIFHGIHIRRIYLKSKYGVLFNSFINLPIFWILSILTILKENNKIDVIHCHDFDTVLIGLFFKYINKTPVIYDIHDLYYNWIICKSKFISNLLQKFIQYSDIILARKVNYLITVTESFNQKKHGLKEYYEFFGIKNIITLWNCPSKNFSDKLKKISPTQFTLGFIGNPNTVDNFILLFNTIMDAEFKDIKILFVGEGLKTECLKRIVLTKYKDLEIEFIQNVPYSQISQYYEKCSVQYVTCNLNRLNDILGISIKVFESIMMNKPVIVCDGTLEGEFVKYYHVGESINFSTETLKNSILKIKNNYYYYENSCNLIKEKWNWELQEIKLLNLYKEIVYKNSLFSRIE